MWIIEQAQDLVRAIEPEIRKLNYHTLLGGGVLHKEGPRKDLDLFFIPLNGHASDPQSVVRALMGLLDGYPAPLRDSPDYGPDNEFHFKEALKFTHDGKRIDVFIQ